MGSLQVLLDIPLLVGIMSFLGTLAASVLTGFFDKRDEQYKWLRQERRVIYSEFLARLSVLRLMVLTWEVDVVKLGKDEQLKRDLSELLDKFSTKSYEVSLICSPLVYEPLVNLIYLVNEVQLIKSVDARRDWGVKLHTEMTKFTDACRSELGFVNLGS